MKQNEDSRLVAVGGRTLLSPLVLVNEAQGVFPVKSRRKNFASGKDTILTYVFHMSSSNLGTDTHMFCICL